MSNTRGSSGAEPEYKAELNNITVIRNTDSAFGKKGDIEDHTHKIQSVAQGIKVSEVEGKDEETKRFLFGLPMFKEWYEDAKRRYAAQQKAKERGE